MIPASTTDKSTVHAPRAPRKYLWLGILALAASYLGLAYAPLTLLGMLLGVIALRLIKGAGVQLGRVVAWIAVVIGFLLTLAWALPLALWFYRPTPPCDDPGVVASVTARVRAIPVQGTLHAASQRSYHPGMPRQCHGSVTTREGELPVEYVVDFRDFQRTQPVVELDASSAYLAWLELEGARRVPQPVVPGPVDPAPPAAKP